ncbi:histidinol-phosphate transaminase [Streptomyces albidoflavus]|uniref:histidinol-phosphate transaminase n=1 Tax=Streptomyces albidoflavus TaxID=1886 RepID=UPI0010210742|nr:histidinol-phosphate transaminase [Streptomyces albidoflavus]RZD60791.1 histidinol-phosphate transaminase [Streptomyces albidoflavus]
MSTALTLDQLPVREELRGKSPYGAPQLDVPVRLNTNENPYPLPEPLVARIAERVAEAARDLNRYPDRDAVELRTELARYLTRTGGHPVAFEQVWAANGSNEVLQQLLQAFGGPGRTALGFEPSYSMHSLIARGTNTGWISGPRREDFTIDVEAAREAVAEHRPDVVFITSPNNPTGTAVDRETVLALHDAAQAVKPTMVVVDEAYVEFSHGASLLPLLEGRPHVVVSRTMSKAFGAAGLRLGYLAADPAVVDALQLVRLPYHLSAVNQATALAALEHTDTLLGYVDRLKAERDRVVQELRALGLDVTDSDANFVQFGRFDGPGGQHAVWQRLLDHGVLVRDNGVPGRLRVSTGTPEENTAFLEAVREVVGSSPDKPRGLSQRGASVSRDPSRAGREAVEHVGSLDTDPERPGGEDRPDNKEQKV